MIAMIIFIFFMFYYLLVKMRALKSYGFARTNKLCYVML